MAHPLLDCDGIDGDVEDYLCSIGNVFARFDGRTQDSGNISYGVQIGSECFFVKTAGDADDPKPLLNHSDRISLLLNAVRLSQICDHPTLPKLYRVIESSSGPALVYQWLEGELLGVPQTQRENPTNSFQRFRNLLAAKILQCLDSIFDLHETIARTDWIAGDFYDGCLIYDFASERLGIVDLDSYREGPFHNEIGRMFGSTRFMAPEEFELGALIDQRTSVFTMGRTALVFLSDGTLNSNAFRGSRAEFDVIAKACEKERSCRFESIAEFYQAWQAARVSNPVAQSPNQMFLMRASINEA